jgi:ABC-type amino acid transport substrate-binding protein
MSIRVSTCPITPGRRNFLKASAVGLGALGAGALPAIDVPVAAAATQVDLSKLQRVKQTLVAPPFAPEHEQTAGPDPKIIEVTIDIIEKKMVIDDEGTEVWALTFGGSVPGPLIVAHEGDYVELTLRNLPDNTMEHNIDFHASTGALGGGALTHVLPGEQAVLRWKATKPGVFVYHCAPEGIMIPYHVVHGMNGAVMVLPRDGLKDNKGNPYTYDKVFYIGEQDYYIPRDEKGAFKKYEMPGENMDETLAVMRTLTPSHHRAFCAVEYNMTMIPISWDGIIPALLEKKMDGIFGSMAMNDERKKKINFSDMYYDSTTVLIGPKGGDKTFTPETLKGKTIGIQSGSSNGNYVEKYYVPAGAVVKAYKGQDEVNADLAAGRIDFTVADAVALKPFLETAEGACCEIIGAVPMDAAILGNGVGVGFRMEDTALRDKVNAAIKSFANKGGFEALSVKYKLEGLMLTAPKS